MLGAGVMGAQIAAHLANAGLNVLLLDVAPKTIGQDGPNNALLRPPLSRPRGSKPDPFMSEAAKRRVSLGNFEDDFAKIGACDWIIEVVVERMGIKRDVMKRIEEHASASAVVSSNTSGLPIGEIAEGRSEGFKKRFLGTHFFNPPRYLKLFEMIPTEETDPEVVARVARFARVHLGKGVVIAKDTPNFIGNRIGVYSMMGAIEMFERGDYTMEEIDQLTGALIGHPKSATFRTADVVGLDTLKHVTENLYAAVEHDESRERFQTRDMLKRLVDLKQTGQKAGAGFYKKDRKRGILSFDSESGEYAEAKKSDLDLSSLKKGDLKTRLANLWKDDGRAGQFFRESSLDLFGYSARRIPEIADRPLEVDRAIAWGFGWEMGPFEQWDTLGVDRVRDALKEADIDVPDWVDAVPSEGFYRELQPGQREVWNPQTGLYDSAAMPKDEVGLAAIKSDDQKTLWQNAEAALIDLGDGVALFEFRSKANSLGQAVMDGLVEAIRKVEDDRDLRGMVIGNEGGNFSVGANLGEVVMGMGMGGVSSIEPFIKSFQDSVQAVRYSTKPVVVATHQRVLGGGCEITMACPNPVAAAETYIGLVELGVGLIPAGTGTMRMAAWAADQAANRDRPSEIQPFLRQAFETIAMANVATSAPMAKELGLLPEHALVVMNDARRFHVAKQEVLRLSEQGYLPPAVMEKIPVLGAAGRAQFDIALYQFKDGKYISEYDQYLAGKLAYIMTGGALTGPAEVHEDYLLELEREVFLSLLGEEKTQERIASILTTNKPLRN